MYSKEETKQFRMDFWEGFRKYSAPKRRAAGKNRAWVLEKTGIKAVNLKFDIFPNEVWVGIAVFHRDKYSEGLYYEKFECLRNILRDNFGDHLIWNPDFVSEEGRPLSMIYVKKENISIRNTEAWNEIYRFFYENMMKFEDIVTEYKEFILNI